MLKVMDLFCGTGGFSKGFENTGAFQVVFGIDVLPLSVETFGLNHPTALGVAGDIRTIPRREVAEQLDLRRGDIDVVIGGPPCQGFSSIRPFRSSKEDDPRNSLFEEFAAYVNYFRPRALVFENVVGLVTHQRGITVEAIQDAFAQLGYDTDWRILNAAHFGVPQKRERLILLGVERGAPIVWPRATHGGDFKTIGHRDPNKLLRPSVPTLFDSDAPVLPSAVTVAEAIDDLPVVGSGEAASGYDRPPRTSYQAARRGAATELTMHCATRHSARMLEIIEHAGPNISFVPEHLISSGFSSCYSRLDAAEPSPTITVNFVHPASNRCIHPRQNRALTPREGARLQSFDDTFRFAGLNRNAIAKQIGNAVPPLLGRAVADTLAGVLGARQLQAV